MRPALTIWLTSCRASRMTRPRSCRGWEPSGGPDAAAGPGHRRLPQQALDRIVARCDITLYYGQGPGHAADGGGREGVRGRCCRPGRCGKAQSDALLARHGFCALAGAGQVRHLPSGTGVTHRGIENLRRLESGRNRGHRLRSRPRRPRYRGAQRPITLASRAVIDGIPSDRAARRGHRHRPAGRRCGIPPSGDNRPSARAPGTSGPGQPPGRLADMKISARRNRKLDRTHCLANTRESRRKG